MWGGVATPTKAERGTLSRLEGFRKCPLHFFVVSIVRVRGISGEILECVEVSINVNTTICG